MKKLYLSLALICCIFSNNIAQESSISNEIKPFHLQNVKLLDGPFFQAEQTDLKYLLTLNPDRLLAPYLREAGLKPKAESYTNWENTGLDGHIGGHYLSALSLIYASTANEEVLKRINYILSELKIAQDKNQNGYLGGVPNSKNLWTDISNGKINAQSFSLNGGWVPWYNIHKIYAGLKDAYIYTNNEMAKEMLIKLSDWSINLVSKLSDEQIQQMLVSEHGGMNEIFADVAEITKDDKYLVLAKKFSHLRILNPLLKSEDKLSGLHANTQIPKVIGYKKIADLTHNTEWDKASAFFWETVVNNRTVAIGGNSVREHFHPINDFSSMLTDIEGPETCNTYNMLKLSDLLYRSSGDLKYIEYYEKALYNHILSSQQPDKGGFVYFTPMRSGHYRVYSQPETSFWCCVGSGMENHAKYGEMIYAHTDEELFVNLFIPSELNWKEKGITLKQETKFPEEGRTNIIIQSSKSKKFTLKIRYPFWVADNSIEVKVNNKVQIVTAKPGSYISINRKWKSGDKVEITLPMKTHLEALPNNKEYQSIFYGPILLAAKTDSSYMDGLYADDSRGGHIAHGKLIPLSEMPVLVSEQNNLLNHIQPKPEKPLTFTVSNIIYPETYKNIELIPFYKLHDSRYMIYWQVMNKEQLNKNIEATATKEKLMLQEQALTVDQVSPGQQQPESDHFFKEERSNSGVFKDRQWRSARGWFSYNLKNKDHKARSLQITYHGLEKNRKFDILINDKKLTTVELDGTKGDDFFNLTFPIPTDFSGNKNDILVIKFQAHPQSSVAAIYDVRLMK
jgi:DUF1680 family protein